MSNLKEYVVVQTPEYIDFWRTERWKKFVLSRGELPQGYRIITTFNADQSLTEDKELTEAVDILKALVALKKHKDTVGKDEYYEKAQPEVWKIANKFLEKHNL